MRIEVRLAGFLKRVGLPGGFTGGSVEAPDSATVADLLAQIGVTKNTPWLITHNGQLAQFAVVLQDGDSILIIPPISGGNEHHGQERNHRVKKITPGGVEHHHRTGACAGLLSWRHRHGQSCGGSLPCWRRPPL